MQVQGLARNYDLSTEPSKNFCNLLRALGISREEVIRSSTLQSNFRKALLRIHDAEDEDINLWCPIVGEFSDPLSLHAAHILWRALRFERHLSPGGLRSLFLPRHQGCRSLFLSVTRTPIRCV
jgi:hypothetical protein